MAKHITEKTSITIKDVANFARVAPSTVSKVVNRTGQLSDETRLKVQDAIRKLNYRPNSIARSLRNNHTRTIGMINNSHTNKNTFVLQLMVGVEESASEAGFSVFLCNTGASQSRENEYLEVLLDKQVDGLIFLDNVVKERSLPAINLGNLPLVFLNQYPQESVFPAVLPNDRQGAMLATDHLLRLGHKRIGFINGRLKHKASHLRLEGYQAALKKAGLEFDSQLVQGKDIWDEKGGYFSVKDLMALTCPPSAIFCANDALAIGALDSLREDGLKVPDDVALIGFDNSLAAAQKRPALSSIEMPFSDMGKLAVKLLLEALEGKNSSEIFQLPCQLAQRDSCGPALRSSP